MKVGVLEGISVDVDVGVKVLEGICVGVFVKVGVLVLGRKGVLVVVPVGVIVGVWVGVPVYVLVMVPVMIGGLKLGLGVEVAPVAVKVIVGVAVLRESGASDSVMKPMQ